MIIHVYREYLLTYTADTPPPPQKREKNPDLCQNSLTTELKTRFVWFMLKKLLTYFEMLIFGAQQWLGIYAVSAVLLFFRGIQEPV